MNARRHALLIAELVDQATAGQFAADQEAGGDAESMAADLGLSWLCVEAPDQP